MQHNLRYDGICHDLIAKLVEMTALILVDRISSTRKCTRKIKDGDPGLTQVLGRRFQRNNNFFGAFYTMCIFGCWFLLFRVWILII